MNNELPIACSLDAGELSARLAEMADLGRSALIDTRLVAARAELRFAAGAGVRARVDAIAAAEAECCRFLTFAVTDEADQVVLSIDAPAGAELVLEELVNAFTDGVPASP